MADSSDAKPNDAGCGPEVLDLTTLQGLPPDAIARLQGLRVEREIDMLWLGASPHVDILVPLRRDLVELGLENPDEFFGIDDGDALVDPVTNAGVALFRAIAEEYALAIVDPLRFEPLLDEALVRVQNFLPNRLIELATGKSIGRWSNNPTPTENEVNNPNLWRNCKTVKNRFGVAVSSSLKDLKREAWERRAKELRCGPYAMLDAPPDPVESLSDNTDTAPPAAVDAFLQDLEKTMSSAVGTCGKDGGENVSPDPVEALPESKTENGIFRPNRAAWLEAEMGELGITKDYLYTSVEPRGPAPASMIKILAGVDVTPAVLVRLSKALSAVMGQKGTPASWESVRRRIPNN